MGFIKGQSNAWKDITGKVFNYLTILGYVGNGKWLCRCTCGKEKELRTAKITTGHTISCGCIAKINALKHGRSKSKEYNIWSNMKSRCNNSKNTAYKNYGGRGIKVDMSWEKSFEQFIEDMGTCPLGASIERKNNSLGYDKNNCIWAFPKEQSFNRRSNDLIFYKGCAKPLKLWCDELALNYKTIFARIHKLKWSTHKAFTYNKV